MTLIDKATALIADCEANVRGLMQTALTERMYGEIPALANLAAGLAQLTSQTTMRSGSTSSNAAANFVAHSDGIARGSDLGGASPSKHRRDTYPRFERHGDRLVKIGWSKKDRCEYEHKASIDTAKTIFATLVSKMNKRGLIRLDDVLPIEHDGAEIPSYQTYLVVAWLRKIGLLEKQGNDGYKFDRQRLSETDVDTLLRDTPERE